jgi:predicted amidophosphoribosyltransferase
MRSRRPPEILRKSHAHSAGKGRAKAKEALKRELETETSVEERDAALDDDTQAQHPTLDDKQTGRD